MISFLDSIIYNLNTDGGAYITVKDGESVGGIVGNIQQFNNGKITISGCTNLATVETTGKAVLHPQQTLKGAGTALKTATVGGALGYVGWQKLTTDDSVVGIVSDALIGKENTEAIGNTIQETTEDKHRCRKQDESNGRNCEIQSPIREKCGNCICKNEST